MTFVTTKHPRDVLADEIADGKVRVNDRRRVRVGESNDPKAPVDRAEQVYGAIFKAVDSYCRTFETSDGSKVRVPTERLEDMARHATANVLAVEAGDPREWVAVKAGELKTGDVIVSYDVIGGVPHDEETAVAAVRRGRTHDELHVDVLGREGKRTVTAARDYVFRVHRPRVTNDDVRSALAEDL